MEAAAAPVAAVPAGVLPAAVLPVTLSEVADVPPSEAADHPDAVAVAEAVVAAQDGVEDNKSEIQTQ